MQAGKNSEEVLRLEDIWFDYNGIPVLEGINLTVCKNDFLGITGPNGGGKTTLLKVILGLVKPARGRVWLMGDGNWKNRKYIGYVPQNADFDRQFPVNVWDVVLTGRLGRAGIFKMYGKRDMEIAAQFLDKVGMYDLRRKKIGELSGGQLQRVLIARALVTEPRLLLLDEPTASVDSRSVKAVYNLLIELNKEIPVVIVSHDIGGISPYVNKIVWVNRRIYNYGETTAEVNHSAPSIPDKPVSSGFYQEVVL